MPSILGANTLSSGFDVANSVRLDGYDSSTRMEVTNSGAGSRQIFTFSTWLKRSSPDSTSNFQVLYSAVDSGGNERIMFEEDKLTWDFDIAGVDYSVETSGRLYRDFSAWYHIVVTKDTTQSTEANRIKMYVNGVQQTLAEIQLGFPDQNANGSINMAIEHQLFAQADGEEFGGYACETVLIDGTAYAADSFGEFDSDSGIWKPIDVSGLTFGTNGFYLKFEDSSALGADSSGNGNNYATANLAAVDQTTDTCTNNFATWNPLTISNGAITEGNLKYTTSNGSSNYGYRLSTIGVNKGKWYAEIKYTSSSVQGLVGIRSREATAVVHYLGYYDDDYGFYIDGSIYQNNGDRGDLGASWGNDDIVGIYLDLDNNKLYFSKNGTLYTATGHDITAAASTTTGNYFFSATEWNSSGNGAFELNVGNPVSALANAAITDDNGYGAFEYSPNITGDSEAKKFYALNTKNLAEFG